MDFKHSPTPTTSSAKVLMLHGHGQSGHFFRCKTQFMQPSVGNALLSSLWEDSDRGPFDVVEFFYPSGLHPADPDHHGEETTDTWTWGHGDLEEDRIRGLETSVEYILRFLETHGPFVGIMGFSAGATVAAIVCSLLEKQNSISGFSFNTTHPPLDFMVSFSGFPLGHPSYNQLYDPKVETPILHVIGTMDTMIDESQSLRLRDRCTDSSLHYFFGTHYVPRDTDFLEALTLFFDHVFKRKEGKEDEWEDLESR